MNAKPESCPCGSKKNYLDCCGAFIDGDSIPSTPEELMRSRYTAYTKANIDYIMKTMRGPAAEHFDPKAAKEWAEDASWSGLQVLKSTIDPEDENKGTVEFIANYILDNKWKVIHEISEFHRIDGQWYYVDGKAVKSGMV